MIFWIRSWTKGGVERRTAHIFVMVCLIFPRVERRDVDTFAREAVVCDLSKIPCF